MKPAMGVGEFALGVLGVDNREEGHGGYYERPERRRER